MITTAAALSHLETKLGHEELRLAIDALRRGPDGFIRQGTASVIHQLHQQHFPQPRKDSK